MADGDVTSSAETPSRADPAYARGVLTALFISVLWSTSAIIYKGVVEASAWQTIFYRSAFLSIGMSIFLVLRYRRQVFLAIWSIGQAGLTAAGCLALASFCFISAIHLTTVANLTFMLGASPFFAALLGSWFLREQVSRATWWTMSIALAGVTIMIIEGVAGGSLTGNVLAVVTAVAVGGFAVALRSGRNVDQVPAILVSGLIAVAVTLFLVDGFVIPWHEMVLCAIQGMFVSGFCNSLFSICARAVPAAELVLFSLLEVALAPVWAYFIFDEIPAALTLVGGLLLIVSVCVHAFFSIRAAR